MKNYLKILIVLSLFIASGSLKAQSKFGHINSADLIQLIPDAKKADTTLRKFGESLDGQLKGMTAEYQTKLQSYQSKHDSTPEAINATKEKELTDLGNRIQSFQTTAQESIRKKKDELYTPILKKAEEAIKAVAKEKGYAYIFDTSVGAFLYAQDSDNIMAMVKAKMGLSK